MSNHEHVHNWHLIPDATRVGHTKNNAKLYIYKFICDICTETKYVRSEEL